MVLLIQPPSPPLVPLSYSPPGRDDRDDFPKQVENPLITALSNLVLLFQDLDENPNESLRYYYTSWFIKIISDEVHDVLHPILYPSSRFEDNLLWVLHGIHTGVKEAHHKAAPTEPPPPAVIDVAPVVAVMNERFDELKKETASSLKSFADAVKASAPTPPLPSASLPKPKFSPPAITGNLLPQAVIQYRGHVDAKSCPSFADLVPTLNHIYGTCARDIIHVPEMCLVETCQVNGSCPFNVPDMFPPISRGPCPQCLSHVHILARPLIHPLS